MSITHMYVSYAMPRRDQSKNFPVGNELGILKWRIPNLSKLPITGDFLWPLECTFMHACIIQYG